MSCISTSTFDRGDSFIDLLIIFTRCDPVFCPRCPCNQSDDNSRRNDRCDAGDYLPCHVGLFGLQNADVTFRGGAIDRLIERLFNLFFLERSARKTHQRKNDCDFFLHCEILPFILAFSLPPPKLLVEMRQRVPHGITRDFDEPLQGSVQVEDEEDGCRDGASA